MTATLVSTKAYVHTLLPSGQTSCVMLVQMTRPLPWSAPRLTSTLYCPLIKPLCAADLTATLINSNAASGPFHPSLFNLLGMSMASIFFAMMLV